MKELLLKYALNLFGFKQDRKGSSQYYLAGCPDRTELFVWYDADYDVFFKRDFRTEDHCDELLEFETLEELQQYILNLK